MKHAVILILLVALQTTSGCGGSAQPPDQKPDQKTDQKQDQTTNTSTSAAPGQTNAPEVFVPSDAKGIRTITIKTQPIPEYLEIPGRVVPDPTRVVHVFPVTTGRVIEMRVRQWDRVQKGQVLALVESGDASRAMADYQKAHTDAELKKKDLDRSTDLYAHHAIAEKELQQAEADAQSADAEMRTTLDHLHLLGIEPTGTANELTVIAPRSGVVMDIGAASGELSKSVDAPQPLCTLADLNTIWVEGEIFEKDLSGLKAGEPAEITLNAYPGEKFKGRVAIVGGAVDPTTRTLTVRIELANPQLRLKPDMFATVRLLRSSTPGLLIPVAAVEREGQSAYVFVAAPNNQFQRREVQLGPILDGNVQVTSGLTSGDAIVSEGAVLLRAASQN